MKRHILVLLAIVMVSNGRQIRVTATTEFESNTGEPSSSEPALEPDEAHYQHVNDVMEEAIIPTDDYELLQTFADSLDQSGQQMQPGLESTIPGVAGEDYPVYSQVPKTGFSCKDHELPGYYADTMSRCQVFWMCQKTYGHAFLCPNGTIFNQEHFVCDWWYNVDCSHAETFYQRNNRLYDTSEEPNNDVDSSNTDQSESLTKDAVRK